MDCYPDPRVPVGCLFKFWGGVVFLWGMLAAKWLNPPHWKTHIILGIVVMSPDVLLEGCATMCNH